MLLAITPNPTIDRTLTVSKMSIGEVHRAEKVHLAAGGKGLNVARTALTLGIDVLATGPLAGNAGRIVASLAEDEQLPTHWHWLPKGETRTCLLINHRNQDATVINEPGPYVDEDGWQDFVDHIESLATEAKIVTFSGSLPDGIEGENFVALTRKLRTSHRKVYIDTSSTALGAVLANPEGLHLKVNWQELSSSLHTSLESVSRITKVGRTLIDRGATAVIITLGKEGALGISQEGCWLVYAPSVRVVSTVGSGDAFLAGLVIAQMQGHSLATALQWATACGSANAMTGLPGRFNESTMKKLLDHIGFKQLF